MAATRRSSRAARKRTPARGRKPARKPAARTPAAREPLLAPGQARDLLGVALCVLAAYSALVIYAGLDGASVGAWLRRTGELFVGRGVIAVPLVLGGIGAAILLRVDTSRLGPLRLGLVCLFLGALLGASTSAL